MRSALLGVTLLAVHATATATTPVDHDWLSKIRLRIAAGEYQASWQRAGWQAPNRRHGFRVWFLEGGIRLVPRVGAEDWSLDWNWTAIGATGAWRPVHTVTPYVELGTAGYRHDRPAADLRFDNSAAGLLQTLVLERPASDGRVTVRFSAAGTLAPRVDPAGRFVTWLDPTGRAVLRTGPLVAHDAVGAPVEVRASAFSSGAAPRVRAGGLQAERGVAWSLEPDGALWPITVAALWTAPAWSADGGQDSAAFGWSLGTAGDVNGDDYSDVVVGSRNYDDGFPNAGAAFVYHGSSGGPSLEPDWTASGEQGGANFGVSTGTAGDVNGDGFSDVIVGARGWQDGELNEGAAFVFHGSARGLAATPAWSGQGDQVSADYGRSVGTAGDVNGDGYSDVVVGASGYDGGSAGEGRAFAYYGSAAGLATAASWTTFGTQTGAGLGWSVGTAGDVNGDGYSDVAVGARFFEDNQGRVVLFLGSAAGLGFAPSWSADGEQAAAWFGHAVATAGDVNGDGYSDLIVGALLYDDTHADAGAAFVFQGSETGLGATAAWTVTGGQDAAELGSAVGTAGDVNGDGYGDVVVGAHLHDGDLVDEGQVRVYRGSALGLADVPFWSAEGDQAGAELGWAAFTAGDVNGDGYSDIAAGARFHDDMATNEGRAQVWFGAAAGLGETIGWQAEADQSFADFGIAVAGAGDVNGDGYDDVLVGARFFDAGQSNEGRAYIFHGSAAGLELDNSGVADIDQSSAQFGFSLGTAGDVNGDGYSDVIVGAPRWDGLAIDEGGAFVYTGSPFGLSTAPVWTIRSGQPGAALGNSVGSAGDVNGDGFSDVVIGIESWDNGQINEGAALVVHGSPTGLLEAVAWLGEGGQVDGFYGRSVATAGDVNGDGFSDVIVGAFAFAGLFSNEGAAFVYHGSPGGLGDGASWTVPGGQDGARFGTAVGPAGDVNGDGFSDVVVGAPLWTGAVAREGAAFVFHGGPLGLGTVATWDTVGGQEDSRLGLAVWTAGDVNGDGFSDVIVGAPEFDDRFEGEGRVLVFHGSPAGVQNAPAWFADGGQSDAGVGRAVGLAGDPDGDGYADPVYGAPGYTDGQTSEGGAFLYYGNTGPHRDVLPTQRRADDAGRIDLLGASDALDRFRLTLVGRSPFGRTRAKLEWQLAPAGLPFGGVATAGDWVETQPAGVLLNETVDGLEPETAYHWRVRVRYDTPTTPFQPHGPWFSDSRNGWRETDLRTMARGAGAVPDGNAIPGEPLRVAVEDGLLRLTWGASCSPVDDGYTVYEGSLGDEFTNHRPVDCAPLAATTALIPQSFGDSYYLVVPRRAVREGSYGTDGAGVERVPSPLGCLPQAYDPATCD